jgi:hypothetical protein
VNDFLPIPLVEDEDVGQGGEDTSDEETEEHKSGCSCIESVTLSENDRIGFEEKV